MFTKACFRLGHQSLAYILLGLTVWVLEIYLTTMVAKVCVSLSHRSLVCKLLGLVVWVRKACLTSIMAKVCVSCLLKLNLHVVRLDYLGAGGLVGQYCGERLV